MLAAGQRVFGENRVQEAQARWAVAGARPSGLELRLIGPLQTNKAKDAVALFDVIETLDRPKLAARWLMPRRRRAVRRGSLCRSIPARRSRRLASRPQEADAFIASVRRDYGFEPEGLMCIPPADEPAGPHFALLAKIAARNGLGNLSMGMSADYETAVMFGATHVRVGSALFGARS